MNLVAENSTTYSDTANPGTDNVFSGREKVNSGAVVGKGSFGIENRARSDGIGHRDAGRRKIMGVDVAIPRGDLRVGIRCQREDRICNYFFYHNMDTSLDQLA